jgi:catechol 2,3-dioxygenase-like lactoylglutathione lyase family enzyme
MRPVLTHIALHVRDLEASVRFYERLCELRCVHRRGDPAQGQGVVWLSEVGRERDFILVLISGGPARTVEGKDFSHLGFAVDSRAAVDRMAELGRQADCLAWPPREEPYPVGYFCALKDPDENFVEFSFGQPLGPGSEMFDEKQLAGAGGYE